MAVLCASLFAYGNVGTYAQPAPQAAVIPNDQLDSLVAPIALYPDPLLAQVLAASTYPLELVQLQQWMAKNPGLKDQALSDAVEKQDWDPSVQAMSALPDLVKQLVENIKWTTELGNAFLVQQGDVMDAVQRMRMKAQQAGNLKSSEQQKVETRVVESKTVVIIEQANPQVVYVPSYNPVVVYGPPIYPYPPIYYPPPSYYAAGMVIAFGIGVAIGNSYHGGWGWGCGWGHSNVNINVNNNYVSHYNRTNVNTGNINTGNINRGNINSGNRPGTGSGNSWQHNPQHRGGVPYSNQNVANKYGGTARGDSMATRQANAQSRQGVQQTPGNMNRGTNGAGAANPAARPAGGGAGTGNFSGNQGRQGAQATPGTMNRGAGSASNMGANTGASGDRVGNRQVPSSSNASRNGAFGGSSGGMNGGAARSSSQRGGSSMSGSRSGGGGRRK